MKLSSSKPIDLLGYDSFSKAHQFEPVDVQAIQAALWSRRPLLLTGEPGIGKTQFAKAAAAALERPFLSLTVDANTEARDLRWVENPIARLAAAQIAGSMAQTEGYDVKSEVALEKFTSPGVLWRAFDWESSEQHCRDHGHPTYEGPGDPDKGVVVLIDEIDKGDEDVPNGLLEALGSRRFTLPFGGTAAAQNDPLIILATNYEQTLPPAFLRRCLFHFLKFPDASNDPQEFLTKRGKIQFPLIEEAVLEQAASMVLEDRKRAEDLGLLPLPGLAEYIDLLAALSRSGAKGGISRLMSDLRPFFLQKHADLRR